MYKKQTWENSLTRFSKETQLRVRGQHWVEVPEEEFQRVKKINALFERARAQDLIDNNGFSR